MPSRFTCGAPIGTRIEITEEQIARVEKFVRESIGEDLQLIISGAWGYSRLVRGLHAELRADGFRHQGPAHQRAASDSAQEYVR